MTSAPPPYLMRPRVGMNPLRSRTWLSLLGTPHARGFMHTKNEPTPRRWGAAERPPLPLPSSPPPSNEPRPGGKRAHVVVHCERATAASHPASQPASTRSQNPPSPSYKPTFFPSSLNAWLTPPQVLPRVPPAPASWRRRAAGELPRLCLPCLLSLEGA